MLAAFSRPVPRAARSQSRSGIRCHMSRAMLRLMLAQAEPVCLDVAGFPSGLLAADLLLAREGTTRDQLT